MDELKLLREMRNDIPIVKDSVIDSGRDQLLHRIAPGGVKKSKRRPRKALRITLMTAATLGLVTALVGGNVIGLAGWRGAASAEAAEVLNNAAKLAINSTDPVLAPGQYLKIDSTNLWLSESTPAVAEGDKFVAGTPVSWLDTEKMSIYVPADRDQEWVWDRSGRVPTTFFSAQAKETALEQAKDIGDTSEHLRAANGAFYGSPSTLPSEKELAGYSRDPRMLLNDIYLKTLGAGQSLDGEALVWIADLLRTGLVPADLRAALYKAASLIPGVSVTDNQATLDGQRGVAIGRVEGASNVRQDIIIDSATGQLIGERQVALEAMGSVPAGATIGWTTIRTTVVDSAP
ncbi:CU044_5270 family protein [Arthrobacter antibioticus]|uniref:CU044_5270 family protein n=1 Tax=Arthrobacter sp. H35-MC1 TaxID=3046203 RepID=UPI0024BAACAA|nr:CU044_5270 family protein [Arthrobacter sp. H35-MC1]MDJ0318656.1 CU044_5270 family protein [Arthrobacter sp. H35-MC1]